MTKRFFDNLLKTLTLAVAMILIIAPTFAQDSFTPTWVDSKAQYDYMDTFTEGFAIVGKDDRYTFMDLNGQELTRMIYDEVKPFSKGLAVVQKGDFYGVINTRGAYVLPLKYDSIELQKDGTAIVALDGLFGVVDTKGNVIIPFDYLELFANQSGTYLAFSPEEDAYGFIDGKGKVQLPFIYSDAYPFEDGMAIVAIADRYGAIDNTGKLVIPAIYDEIDTDYALDGKSLLAALKNNRYGYIDRTGKEVLPFTFENAFNFQNGVAIVSKEVEDKATGETISTYALIDTAGKLLTDYAYNNMDFANKENTLIKVQKNESYGYIDLTGKEIVPPTYESAYYFTQGLAIVSVDEKYGMIDGTGKVVIPLIYDDLSIFDTESQVALAYKDDLYGLINKKGEFIITPQYDYLQNFENGYALVYHNDRFGYLVQPNVKVPTLKASIPFPIEKLTLTPLQSKVTLNGNQVRVSGYSYNNEPYFKIRDIAHLVDGTSASFNVFWHQTQGAVALVQGINYKAIGGEGSALGTKALVAIEVDMNFIIDSELSRVPAMAYKGEHYYSQSTLESLLNILISFDAKTNTIDIETEGEM